MSFRFSLPTLVLYHFWVETLFLALSQSRLVHVLLLCFVIVVKRDLSVAVVVLKFSNGKIIYVSTTHLASSVVIGEAYAVLLASQD